MEDQCLHAKSRPSVQMQVLWAREQDEGWRSAAYTSLVYPKPTLPTNFPPNPKDNTDTSGPVRSCMSDGFLQQYQNLVRDPGRAGTDYPVLQTECPVLQTESVEANITNLLLERPTSSTHRPHPQQVPCMPARESVHRSGGLTARLRFPGLHVEQLVRPFVSSSPKDIFGGGLSPFPTASPPTSVVIAH
ncbi:hypothetical protein N7462_001769 [Penicillium macrosclerotiorum]|uniref:uncharacterized protein n=1 Tax=Penicillium macrosclerotiorum TaxID=303699 RepID=UPI002548D87B|nr:uncharacterized protein N7462_001769 [Penicillium macrosclerotiorum]KAJ5692346.1 hypothetical protein N7462_001769 [Penicillium macrosclerotiorum]